MQIKNSNVAEAESEGKIRLSLIDVIYGVIMGYGFNFFVDRDPTDVTLVLFLLTMSAIVSDWLFVHKPYWSHPGSYTNVPFLIDLMILLSFAFMIRFAVKEPNNGLLLCLAAVFTLYSIWDYACSEPLKQQGRVWSTDLAFDLVGAVSFFSLWRFSKTKVLTHKLIDIDLPNWVGFDIEVQIWMAIAILIYILLGPHPLADRIKGIFIRNPTA